MSGREPRIRRRTAGYAIPPPKGPSGPSKRGPSPGLVLALGLLGVLVVLVSIGAYRLFAPAGSPVTLPDFAGMPYDVAQHMADRVGVTLRIVSRHTDDSVAKDDVLGQFPAAREQVRRGRIIDVVVSDGPTVSTVPDLSNLSLRDAQIALANARLDLGNITKEKSDTVSSGRILSQSPVALTPMTAGSKVDVVVAQGKPETYVPNFIGLSIGFSQSAAKEANVALGPPLWTPVAKGSKPRGVVVAQDPLPGQPLSLGDKVILHVSGGPPATPTPLPTVPPTEAPVITTPAPESPSPSAAASPGESPTAAPVARSMRIQVALPALPSAKNVRVALVDATGSHDIYNQSTKGGFTLQFDVTVTGDASVETYIEGTLTTTNKL